MDDVGKVVLGAVLAIAGGFAAQLYSEFLRVREVDYQVLQRIHADLQKLYAIYSGNVCGAGKQQVLDGVALEIMYRLEMLPIELRTRKNRMLAVRLRQLFSPRHLVDADTLLKLLDATQNHLNPKVRTAYERDDFTQMIGVKKQSKIKKLLLIFGGCFLCLVLIAFLYAFVIVKGSVRYEFMRGARQDGFDAPIMNGHPEVMRFYTLDRNMDVVVHAAQLELSPERGWEHVEPKGAEGWWLVHGSCSLIISPIPGSTNMTSITVWQDATKPEEILGTMFQWIPDRLKEMRR